MLTVEPPLNVQNNTNVTLHFKVEKISTFGIGLDYVKLSKNQLPNDVKSAKTNFTPPYGKQFMFLKRNIISGVDAIVLEAMPGFRFSWWYTCTSPSIEILPEPKYKDKEMSKHLRRY